MATGGGSKAIIAAFLANTGIAISKLVAFAFTGSSSMLAESVHSFADAGNQGLLLIGGRRAKRAADAARQFGYGSERYFYAFMVAVVLFTLGSAFALFEGYEKLKHPHELESPEWAIGVLLAAIVMEAFSFRTAIVEANHVRTTGWVEFIRRAKAPELPVVLLEDLGAMVGLVLALGGVTAAIVTGDPMWDGLGTISIGVLLGVIAVVLALETKSLLVGEPAAADDAEKIRIAAQSHPGIDTVIHMRTQYLGPEELLVGIKVDASDKAAAVDDLATVIDEVEAAIRAAVPAARYVYIEPALNRPT